MYLNYGAAGFVIRNNGDVTTMVMTPDNKVGIGSTTPETKLEINASSVGTGFKLVDGSQGAGKLLTSDDTGKASWQVVQATKPTVTGVMGSSGIDIPSNTASLLYTGTYIDIPAQSKYVVNVNFIMSISNGSTETATPADSSYWLRTTFTDSPSGTVASGDIVGTKTLISGLLPGSSIYAMLSGSVIINNTSAAPKRYYYMAGNVASVNMAGKSLYKFGGTNWSEGGIYAVPIN